MTYLNSWEKNTVNQEFYFRQNYPSKMKKKLIRTFPDKQKLREFVTSLTVLENILKITFKSEMKKHCTVIES